MPSMHCPSLPGLRAQWLANRHALAVMLGRTPDQTPPDLDLASLTVPGNVPVVVPSELLASRHPCAKEMDAYERVLGDAMAGDATLFAREDYVEEAWRIVDPALQAGTPVHEYEPQTWGPEATTGIKLPGGWRNPVMNGS